MRVLLPLAHNNNNDDEGEEEQEGIEVFLPDDFQITESTEQAIRLASSCIGRQGQAKCD